MSKVQKFIRYRHRASRGIPVALAVLVAYTPVTGAAAQGGPALEPLLIFDQAISNPGPGTSVLVKLAVESRLVSGEFGCLGGAEPLFPLADYHVTFQVAEMRAPPGAIRTTTIDAEPPLKIDNGGVARFTVSVHPDDIGACGAWVADIRIISILGDGKRLESAWRRITSEHLDELRSRPLTPERLQAVLCGTQDKAFEYYFDFRFFNSHSPEQAAFVRLVRQIPGSGVNRLGRERLAQWIGMHVGVVDPQVEEGLFTIAAANGLVAVLDDLERAIVGCKDGVRREYYCKLHSRLRRNSGQIPARSPPPTCRDAQ